jgi:hypothetical protein
MFEDVLNKPVTWREWLDYRYDVSIWQKIARMIRAPYRRQCYPNGPEWFARRLSSANLIMALRRCSFHEAAKEQAALDASRLRVWHQGF